MNCPECEKQMYGTACSCGYEAAPRSQAPAGSRSSVSTKTGITYYLCEWGGRCNMPVRTHPHPGETLCRYHKACERAPDQAYHFESFQSWHERMLSFKYDHGWWGKDTMFLWAILQGERNLL